MEALGFSIARSFQTGVELNGTLPDCIKLNLNLRCASQVLFALKDFAAAHPDDVYRELLTVEWEKLIDVDGYFSITSNVDDPSVNNSLFVNVKVKDAIADSMRKTAGRRPNSGADLTKAVFHLFWSQGTATLFLDTSGETLAKHGYRKIPGKAPMLEALAAASVMATQWNKTAAFVNPMCGSGTVAIEAAMLATNRKPGLYRSNYSFMHVVGYDPGIYDQERLHLFEQIKETSAAPIVATDLSEDAIEISKVNAAAAGVEHLIQFEVCDFAQTTLPAAPGVIFFNPEYGDRLGEEIALVETYSRIGDYMKKECKGYMGYIFTGNLELAKKIGLKAKRRIEFFNSKIDCRLLEYELYAGSKNPRPVQTQETA